MLRKFVIAAALSVTSFIGFSSAASAQSYGGVTLSFGSVGSYYNDDSEGAYPPYENNQPYYRDNRKYTQDYYNQYYRNYWAQQQRQAQLDRWQRQREIERWRHEQRERQHWQHDRYDHQRHGDRDEEGD